MDQLKEIRIIKVALVNLYVNIFLQEYQHVFQIQVRQLHSRYIITLIFLQNLAFVAYIL